MNTYVKGDKAIRVISIERQNYKAMKLNTYVARQPCLNSLTNRLKYNHLRLRKNVLEN